MGKILRGKWSLTGLFIYKKSMHRRKLFIWIAKFSKWIRGKLQNNYVKSCIVLFGTVSELLICIFLCLSKNINYIYSCASFFAYPYISIIYIIKYTTERILWHSLNSWYKWFLDMFYLNCRHRLSKRNVFYTFPINCYEKQNSNRIYSCLKKYWDIEEQYGFL